MKSEFKINWILLFVLFFSSFSFSVENSPSSGSFENNVKACRLVSHEYNLQEGSLSDYWAQELIGSDLLRKELEKIPAPDISPWISVFDTLKRNHDVHVKNLISAEGLQAVLPELEEKTITVLDSTSVEKLQKDLHVSDERKSLVLDEKVKAKFSLHVSNTRNSLGADIFKERLPHYINSSMSWITAYGEVAYTYELFQELSSDKNFNPIIVSSAGNDFPTPLSHIKSQGSKEFDAIIVGSLSLTGVVSDFSQSGREVHILAPADTWISSVGKSGKYNKFGRTSATAPLVTGSLAGFEWLSGYHPTAKEAKILLEKTALMTLHSHEEPRMNGVGLLNSYKLGEVAKRLKEKCKRDSFCFKREILKDENYHFTEDKDLRKDISTVFPSCSVGEVLENSFTVDCEEKKKLFERLRKSALLNPSPELLRSLSCIYKKQGFTQNAEFLDSLAVALGTKYDLTNYIRDIAKKQNPLSKGTLRLMIGFGGFEEEFRFFENKKAISIAVGMGKVSFIEGAFNTGKPSLQKHAIYLTRHIAKEKALPLLETAFAIGDKKLQKVVLDSASYFGKSALHLLEEAYLTEDRELQKAVVRSASSIGESALSLLEEIYLSGDRELQKAVVRSVRSVGEPALSLLEEAYSTRDRELQKEVVYSLRSVGEPALPLLEEAYLRGDRTGDKELKKSVVYSARYVGEPALPLLKRAFLNGDKELQKEVILSASYIGEPALPLLEEAYLTGDRELQKEVIRSASSIGEPALFLLEEVFLSKDRELIQEVWFGIRFFEYQVIFNLLERVLANPELDRDLKIKVNLAFDELQKLSYYIDE